MKKYLHLLVLVFVFVSIGIFFVACENGTINKFEDNFVFMDSTLDNDFYKKIVSNTVDKINLNAQISVNKGYEFQISTNENCNDFIIANDVSLQYGNNYFYVLVNNDMQSVIHKICIRRKPIYTVTFNTLSDFAIDNQEIEEGGIALLPQNPQKEGYTFKCNI